jgi:anaerobic selenocysteine-containing dehydrogenase
VRADTPDGAAIIYHDLHPQVEASDPESAGRFNLGVGDMPQALSAYARAKASVTGYDFKLVSRRTRHRFNSTGGHLSALKAKRTTNPAHINPDDLKALGIETGALISITSPAGAIIGVAEASPTIRRGIVSMAHAWGDETSGAESVRDQGVSTNRLVQETSNFDLITGQSLQSAIPVRIAAAP